MKGREKYLTEIRNISIRQQVTKFWLSNHKLAIETGRHEGVERDERVCPFCPNEVEDEVHFLLKCPILKHLRDEYLEPLTCTVPGFEFFADDFKLKTILTDVEHGTCKFIALATDLRNFLASKPKSLG